MGANDSIARRILSVARGWIGVWAVCQACNCAGPASIPCPEDLHRCMDAECHECCLDEDCGAEKICNEVYECTWDCLRDGQVCNFDADCCSDLVCDLFTSNCEKCRHAADCRDRPVLFAEDLQCFAGRCRFSPCGHEADCSLELTCFEWGCITLPGCDQVASCRILPEQLQLRPGSDNRLAAYALLADGRLMPGAEFSWHSADPGVAEVQAGRVTGGAAAGQTIITASLAGCPIACQVRATNHGPAPDGEARVVVFEAGTGSPIASATVSLTQGPTAETNALGVALLPLAPSVESPQEVTISHAGHHYLTLRRVTNADLRLPLERRPDPGRAGGVQVELDLVRVRCPPDEACVLVFGLAGASIPLALHRLQLRELLGQAISTRVELGGTTEWMTFPAGMMIGLNSAMYKSLAHPVAEPGPRLTWALAGRADLADLIEQLFDESDLGGARAFLTYLSSLHAEWSDTGRELVVSERPMLLDRYDLDADGQISDLVPDFAGFEKLELQPRVEATTRLDLIVPRLPVDQYDCVLALAGVMVRGYGLVPLGVGGGVVPTEELRPGQRADLQIQLPVAEVAGRFPAPELQRAILVLAFNRASFSSDRVPIRLAGQVLPVQAWPVGQLTLDPFLEQAEITWDPSNRLISTSRLPNGADLVQVVLHDDQGGGWFVLADASQASFSLPMAPPEGDRATGAAVLAVQTRLGLGSGELFTWQASHHEDLLEWVRAFSYTETER